MRSLEIRSGTVDVRLDPTGTKVCLVFEAADAGVRLFRTMELAEARAFVEHCERVLGEPEADRG